MSSKGERSLCFVGSYTAAAEPGGYPPVANGRGVSVYELQVRSYTAVSWQLRPWPPAPGVTTVLLPAVIPLVRMCVSLYELTLYIFSSFSVCAWIIFYQCVCMDVCVSITTRLSGMPSC